MNERTRVHCIGVCSVLFFFSIRLFTSIDLATVQLNDESEAKRKREIDPLACHHFFNLCYALTDKRIDGLSMYMMCDIEEDRITFSQSA